MLLTCVMFAACASTPERTKESGKTPEVSAEVQSGLLQGDQAYRRGDTDRALFHYVTALNLDPENTDLLYRIGMIHSENKSLDAADQAFNQILALQPDHAGALEGHGLVLLRQRKYAEAKQLLETVVQKDSGRWRAYNGLGVISDINNNHALAISYYELALQQRPGSPMIFNNLGYSYYLDADWESAEKAFNQAVNSDPDHRKTWSNLGMLYVRTGRYDEALQAFTRFMPMPEAYNTMGYICMLEGNFDRAEAFFGDAIRLSPSYYGAAHENLARARARESGAATGKTETGHVYGLELDSDAPRGQSR
jgi:Flp pilus assembly protein TadD